MKKFMLTNTETIEGPGEVVVLDGIVNTEWREGDTYDEMKSGPFKVRKVSRTSKVPANSWPHVATLPNGSYFEVRKDLSINESINGYNVTIHHAFAGKVIQLHYAVEAPRGVTTRYIIANTRVTTPELGARDAAEEHWTIGMMNSAKLPNGTVIVFPWGDGVSAFGPGHAVHDFQQNFEIADGVTCVVPKSVATGEEFNNLPIGSVLRALDGSYWYLMKRLQENGATYSGIQSSSLHIVRKKIREKIISTQDIELFNNGGRGDEVRYRPGYFTLVGSSPLPDVPVAVPVPYEELKVGDIVIINTRNNERATHGAVVVRYVGKTPNYTQHNYVWTQDAVPQNEDEVWAVEDCANWGNDYKFLRIGHVDLNVPGELANAASEEDWTESGIDLVTTDMDVNDVRIFRSVFTRTMLKELKAAGIKRIDPVSSAHGTIVTDPAAGAMYLGAEFALGDETREPLRTMITNADINRLYWAYEPSRIATQEIYVMLSDGVGLTVAQYFPIVKALNLPSAPIFLNEARAQSHRKRIAAAAKWASEVAEAAQDPKFHQEIADYQFSSSLKSTFGITRLPNDTELIFGSKFLKLRAAADGEEPDIVIKGRPFKTEHELADVDKRIRATLALLDSDRTFAEAVLHMKLKQRADALTEKVIDEVVTPKMATGRKLIEDFKTEMDEKVKEVRAAQKEVKATLGSANGLITNVAHALNISEGLVKATLPTTDWYTRITDDGFVEACLDTVSWTPMDKNRNWKVTTPVKLRFRVYYNKDRRTWGVAKYTEVEDARVLDRLFQVHPHVFVYSSYGFENEIRHAFPTLHDEYTRLTRTAGGDRTLEWSALPAMVNFCFGMIHITEPTSGSLTSFLKSLKEYFGSVNRVMYSVGLAGGTDGSHGLYRMMLVGHATSDTKIEDMLRDAGWTRERAAAEFTPWTQKFIEKKAKVDEYLAKRQGVPVAAPA